MSVEICGFLFSPSDAAGLELKAVSGFSESGCGASRRCVHILPVDSETRLLHSGAGLLSLDCLYGAGEAAPPVGAEGNDGFAGEILLFEERVEDHGHVSPPVGVSGEDRVVRREIGCRRYFRTYVTGLFLLSQTDKRPVFPGVGGNRFEAEEAAAGLLPDEHGHVLRVPRSLSVHDHGAVFFIPCHM